MTLNQNFNLTYIRVYFVQDMFFFLHVHTNSGVTKIEKVP